MVATDLHRHLSILMRQERLPNSPYSHLVSLIREMVIDLRLVADKLAFILLCHKEQQPQESIQLKQEMKVNGSNLERAPVRLQETSTPLPSQSQGQSPPTHSPQQNEASSIRQGEEFNRYMSKSQAMGFAITRPSYTSSLWQGAFHINHSPLRITEMQFPPTPPGQEFDSWGWFDRSGSSGLQRLSDPFKIEVCQELHNIWEGGGSGNRGTISSRGGRTSPHHT